MQERHTDLLCPSRAIPVVPVLSQALAYTAKSRGMPVFAENHCTYAHSENGKSLVDVPG